MRFQFWPVLTLLFFIIASPAFAARSPFTGLPVTGIDIKDEEGNPWKKPDQIRELMVIKPGDVFSGPAIREGISLLYLKGTFRDIRVDAFPDNNGVRLEYILVPVTIVRKLEFRGNSTLSDDAIREALPRLEGKELRQDKLPEFRTDILALYQTEGFYDAEVSFRIEPLSEPHEAALIVGITENSPITIAEISFVGNTLFRDKDLIAVMKSRPGKRLRRDQLLDADLEAIRKKYAAFGYPAAKPGPVNISFRDMKAYVTIYGDEGPHVSVGISGNRSFSASKLNSLLLIWSERDVSDEVVDSSAEKIKTFYRENGYPDVAVEVRRSGDRKNLKILFVVTEGPRVLVRNISIEGAHAFTVRQLKKQMALREPGPFSSQPFREDLLDKDVDNLRDRYLEAGYLAVSVKQTVVRSSDNSRADVTIGITEGARSMTGAISFSGNTAFSAPELLAKLSLKTGTPFNERVLDEDKYRVLSAYTDKGYLYARVDVERTPHDNMIDVLYRITEDRQVRIGRIILQGNERTRDYVITRELLVKPGDPYNYSALLASQQRIYRLGYFRLAKFEPVHPGEKEYVKDLVLVMEERPAGTMEFGVGYGDLDRVRGSVELSYRNLWGTARYTSLRFEESDILKRAIFNYQEPWFLGRSVVAKFSLVWSDSDKLNSDTREIYYKTRKTSAAFGVEKEYEHLKPSLTYQFENVVNYDVLAAAELTPEDSGRVLVSSLSPALIYDLRDDVFNPHRGALYGITLKEAVRELFSQAHFSKLTLQASWFVPVNSSVLALSARAGAAWPFSNTAEVPLHERFYVGGSTTVRGFTQDQIGPSVSDANGNAIPQGGQSMAIFNAELRINPGEGLGLVLFTDAGNVWPGQQINITDLRSSYGAGIRYGTPIGPLRIDYGQKMHRLPGESPGEVHFNIGNTF